VQVLPVALLAAPTPVMLLPLTHTGALTGTAALFPDPTPGELLDVWPADADEPPLDDPPEPDVPQELPVAELAAPTTVMSLPLTHTGALIGTEMLLPESTPGLFFEDWVELAVLPEVGAGVAPLPVRLSSRPPTLDVPHVLPVDELAAPMPLPVLPLTQMGASTGACALLPDATPGEPLDVPVADDPSATAYPTFVSSNPPVATAKAKPRLARSCIGRPLPIT
jgi:hypothetical protein